MYSSYGVVGELNSDLLAEDPENISICYYAVILDFFDSLESGLLSGLEKTPIAFFSESVFLTFAYSVCTKLSSFGHVLGMPRHIFWESKSRQVISAAAISKRLESISRVNLYLFTVKCAKGNCCLIWRIFSLIQRKWTPPFSQSRDVFVIVFDREGIFIS
ncbi:hypothetical protein CEXT_375071 [Caerostris extrusa]|uniref:Uncharacterized protein n=1 Tax=Caerostris extrusa TaxID=172846 RepID=A0AAV4UAR9_CAEEX|nr:hypothetical protein CEXT_375071 [Caerostris extrusa]